MKVDRLKPANVGQLLRWALELGGPENVRSKHWGPNGLPLWAQLHSVHKHQGSRIEYLQSGRHITFRWTTFKGATYDFAFRLCKRRQLTWIQLWLIAEYVQRFYRGGYESVRGQHDPAGIVSEWPDRGEIAYHANRHATRAVWDAIQWFRDKYGKGPSLRALMSPELTSVILMVQLQEVLRRTNESTAQHA